MTPKGSTCRACGALIKLVQKGDGKWLALEPNRRLVFTDAGEAVSGREAHQAHCPQRDYGERMAKLREQLEKSA
jgi:hypothetical protein